MRNSVAWYRLILLVETLLFVKNFSRRIFNHRGQKQRGLDSTTEYAELQQSLSGVHSIMRVKLARAGEGGGCTTFTIISKVAVYALAEWADTITLFHLW
jgi:hypothetical protein